MTDLDLRLREELDVLFPEPRLAPRWEDVLVRTRRPLRRRPLVLAFAAVVVVLASAAAVTAALGGFDAWLSGKPGKPAPEEEQQRFEAANGRTWAAFPKSTRLRELLWTKVEGKTFVLFGFRSGSTVCLKLKAISLGHSTVPACVPVATIAHATAPIVVVQGDSIFQDRHGHSSAEASFGIVADGVAPVEVRDTIGTHPAAVGGNAYLFVANEPNTGDRVLAVSARGADGTRTTIRLTQFSGGGGPAGASPPPRGPARVEVRMRHPGIRWALAGGSRHVKPDQYSDVVVGLERAYCLVLEEGTSSGRSCGNVDDFFSRGPINTILSNRAGEASAVVAGAAADGIVRVVAFGADGQQVVVPLRSNLFAVRLGSGQLPVRLVGYDRRGRIAAVQTVDWLARTPLPFGALRHMKVVRRVPGPSGTTATLRVGPVVEHVRCWRVDFTGGGSRNGCASTSVAPGGISALLVQAAGRDLFLIGATTVPVERLRLRFRDGSSISARPTRGVVVLPIPRAHVTPQRQLAYAFGLRRDGSVFQRQGVLFKLQR